MAHDVFISYSSQDKAIADAICATLEGRRIRCWIAPRDIMPGVPYGEALIDALTTSRVLVLVFSAHANISSQVAREVERACSKGLAIVPFRIEDVPMSKEMEFYLSLPHWLDALTPPLEQHLAYLAETVSLLLERMTRGPAAPGQADAATTSQSQAAPIVAERPLRSRVTDEQPQVPPAPSAAAQVATPATGARIWADEQLEQLFLSSSQPVVRDLFLLAKEVNFNGLIQWRGRKANASFNFFVPTRRGDGSLSANILARYDEHAPFLRVFLNWAPDIIRPDALAEFKAGLKRLFGSAIDINKAAPAVPLVLVGRRFSEFRAVLLKLRDAQLAALGAVG